MKNALTNQDCNQILNSFRIFATTARVKVLKVMLEKQGKEFTMSELQEIVRLKKLQIGISTLISTVALFKTRNLIQESIRNRNLSIKKSGRPEIKLTLQRETLTN